MNHIDQINQAIASGDAHKMVSALTMARLLIESQNEQLQELEQEYQDENTARVKMENAMHNILQNLEDARALAHRALPVTVQVMKDFTSHVNRMAAEGVEPYAKKKRAKKQ